MLPNATYPLRLEKVPISERQDIACQHSCLVPGIYVYIYTRYSFTQLSRKFEHFFLFVVLEFSSTRMTTGMPCDPVRAYVYTYLFSDLSKGARHKFPAAFGFGFGFAGWVGLASGSFVVLMVRQQGKGEWGRTRTKSAKSALRYYDSVPK